MMETYYLFRTKWGVAGMVITDKGICGIELPLPDHAESLVRKRILKIFPTAIQSSDPKGLAYKAINAIQDYYQGRRIDLNLPLDLSGLTPFQKKVYQHLKRVGYGKVRTYKWLAESIGAPEAARAVAGALARNPIPLIIPCHRIIRSNGTLGGFSGPGGVNMKKRMLNLEA